MRIQIASLVANKGMGIEMNESHLRFRLFLEVLSVLEEDKKKILDGLDVILTADALSKLKSAIEHKLYLILQQASNSNLGETYEILGKQLKLYLKGFEIDREIKFLNSLLKMVDQTYKTNGYLYILNRSRYQRNDNAGVMFSILSKNNGSLSIHDLLTIINSNRRKIEGAGEQMELNELLSAIEYFQNLGAIVKKDDDVSITEKGRALILN